MSTIKTAENTRKYLGMGLNHTYPYYINTTTLHDFTLDPNERLTGYILYVLEDTVLNAASVFGMEGDSLIGVTLGKGLYHFPISKIQLDSGSVIVYRTTGK